MKVAGIGVAIPSRRVSNDDVVQMIAEQRPRDAMSEVVKRSALNLLRAAGSDVRYYRDRGERAQDFVVAAMRRAIERAGIGPQQVDLLMHCGIARGFIEP